MPIDPALIALIIEVVMLLIENCPESEALRRLRLAGLVEMWLLKRALVKAGVPRDQLRGCLAYVKAAATAATDEELLDFVKEAQAKKG